MFSLFAQAAVEAPEDLIERGIEITNQTLIFIGVAFGIYIALLVAGRFFKRRVGLPLGLGYHLFCISAALFVTSRLPGVDLPFGEKDLGAALVLTGACVVIGFVRHYCYDRFATGTGNSQVPKFLSQFASIAVIVAASLFVLQGVYELPVPGLLAGAGVLGLVLGLALQDTLGNIFSGFAIYFGGQFKAGDWLLVENHHAQIVEINWRSTRLRTNDDVHLDIPNNSITKQTVVNYSYPTSRHGIRMDIGLEYDASPTLIKQVLIDAALDCSKVLRNPEPTAYLKEFGDWSITYQLRFWIDDHEPLNAINSEIRTTLWHSLKRHKIAIPYPIQHEQSLPRPEPYVEDRELIRESMEKTVFASCLSEEQLEQIVATARIVRFGAGEKIIRQHAPAGPMYVLVSGEAEVFVETQGADASVAMLQPGACIGESSVLTGEMRSATIRARADCEAVEVNKATLAPIMSASQELLESLSEMLATRRMQNEGVVAGATSGAQSEKKQDYKAGFLGKLKSFFAV